MLVHKEKVKHQPQYVFLNPCVFSFSALVFILFQLVQFLLVPQESCDSKPHICWIYIVCFVKQELNERISLFVSAVRRCRASPAVYLLCSDCYESKEADVQRDVPRVMKYRR